MCLCLLGLMAAAVQVVPLALLLMRPVRWYLYSLGLCQQGDLRAMALITRRLCVALRWCKVPGNISRGSRLGPVLCRQVISGCIPQELGCSPQRQGHQWALRCPQAGPAYQCLKAKGNPPDPSAAGPPCSCENRQHHSSGICQQTRRHGLSISVHGCTQCSLPAVLLRGEGLASSRH